MEIVVCNRVMLLRQNYETFCTNYPDTKYFDEIEGNEFHYLLSVLKEMYDVTDDEAVEFVYSSSNTLYKNLPLTNSKWFTDMLVKPWMRDIVNREEFYEEYLCIRKRDRLHNIEVDMTLMKTFFLYIVGMKPNKRFKYTYEITKYLNETDATDILYMLLNPQFHSIIHSKYNELKASRVSRHKRRSVVSILKNLLKRIADNKISYISILTLLCKNCDIADSIMQYVF